MLADKLVRDNSVIENMAVMYLRVRRAGGRNEQNYELHFLQKMNKTIL